LTGAMQRLVDNHELLKSRHATLQDDYKSLQLLYDANQAELKSIKARYETEVSRLTGDLQTKVGLRIVFNLFFY
jgi:hypothetical protein